MSKGKNWERFRNKLKWNHILADKFTAINREGWAYKLRCCSVTEMLWFCTHCMAWKYRTQHCKLRICAFCQVGRIIELQERVEFIAQSMDKPKMLTLTMPRCQDLETGIKTIREAWKKLINRKEMRNRIKGGCYAIEIKPKKDGWHVHIHAILKTEFIPVKKLWALWAEVLNIKTANADIRQLEGQKALSEAIKYCTKQVDLIKLSQDQLEEYVRCTWGKRLFTTFGEWYNPNWEELINKDGGQELACDFCKKTGTMIPIQIAPYLYKDDWPTIRDYELKGLAHVQNIYQNTELEKSFKLHCPDLVDVNF